MFIWLQYVGTLLFVMSLVCHLPTHDMKMLEKDYTSFGMAVYISKISQKLIPYDVSR